jgi:hypothetical protein
MAKRAAPQEDGTLIKRARSSEPEASNQQQLAISSSNDERQKALVRSVKRTSNLEAPIVSLSGAHGVSFQGQCLLGTQRNALLQAEILSCRFDPTGQNIAACSADRGICASWPSRSYFLIFVPYLLQTPFTSVMANVSPKFELWAPFHDTQSACIGPAMVPILTPSLQCFSRSHSCIYRFIHRPARTQTPRPPRDHQLA